MLLIINFLIKIYRKKNRLPIEMINYTLQSKNINKNDWIIELIEIEAKEADSSVVPSSNTSEVNYKPPPKVEVDDYPDAFRHTYMGPNSKSFVNLTPVLIKNMKMKQQEVRV